MITRTLDQSCLDLAAKDYAAMYLADRAPHDRAFVMTQVYNFTYKDEFNSIVAGMRTHLGPAPLAEFDKVVVAFEPRSDETFLRLLNEKRPKGYDPGIHYHGWYAHDHGAEDDHGEDA